MTAEGNCVSYFPHHHGETDGRDNLKGGITYLSAWFQIDWSVTLRMVEQSSSRYGDWELQNRQEEGTKMQYL